MDEGNLEVKTHPDGKVAIDVIPTGSSVRIQVIADGFATFADDYVVNEERACNHDLHAASACTSLDLCRQPGQAVGDDSWRAGADSPEKDAPGGRCSRFLCSFDGPLLHLPLPAASCSRNAPSMPEFSRKDRSSGAVRPLAGKTVLVTGAAKRIGRAIALRLAAGWSECSHHLSRVRV